MICWLIAVPLLVVAISWFVSLKPTPEPTPLQQYSEHLCDVYLDEPDVHRSILQSKRVKFIEPLLVELDSLPSQMPISDLSIKGDLDANQNAGQQINLSRLFNTATGHGHRVFVQGRPGTGKTTLLKQLSKMWANAKRAGDAHNGTLSGCAVMLLVCLRDLWSYPNPRLVHLQDLFTSIGSKPFLEFDLGNLLPIVPEKQLCILLDGLDEYAPGYTEHSNYIHQIINGKKLKKATVIVTSRPEAISVIPRNYEVHQRIEIVGFDWERVRDFVTSYYESKDREKSTKLLSYLREKKVVRFMCYIPLYLHMLIFINNDFLKLPVTPTEIYVSFTIQTLREELKNIDEDLLLTDQCLDLSIHYEHLAHCSPVLSERFAAICHLAYKGIYNLVDDTLTSERPSVIAQFPKRDVPNILHNHSLGLLFSHQVIKPLGAIERVYTFQHFSFQQFLATYHLSQMAFTHQVDVIKYPHFPGNMSTFFCGLCGLDIQNESMLFTVIRHLLTDLYVDSLPLAVQCVFESQHTEAAVELLRLNHGKFVLSCIHQATVVLSYPTMTKATMVSYDESHFQVAMEYIFTEAHSSITDLELTEETCTCPMVEWQDVVRAAPSLSSLSSISVKYCSEDSVNVYLDIFSVILVKAAMHLKKIKVTDWPVAPSTGILDRIQSSNISYLSQMEFVCHYNEILSMNELLGLLSGIACRKAITFGHISLHCATSSIFKFYQPVSGINQCEDRIHETFGHLNAEPFSASASPGDRHCESWHINLHNRSTKVTAYGNQYLEKAIEWVIDFETDGQSSL